jgi:hypothetical protein
MSLVDGILAAAILAGALWLFYRTLVRQGGACHGCSQSGSCHAPSTGVVKLGGGSATPPSRRGAH